MPVELALPLPATWMWQSSVFRRGSRCPRRQLRSVGDPPTGWRSCSSDCLPGAGDHGSLLCLRAAEGPLLHPGLRSLPKNLVDLISSKPSTPKGTPRWPSLFIYLAVSGLSGKMQDLCWAPAHRLLCPWGFSRQEYWSGAAISSSRGSSRPRGRTCVSCIG